MFICLYIYNYICVLHLCTFWILFSYNQNWIKCSHSATFFSNMRKAFIFPYLSALFYDFKFAISKASIKADPVKHTRSHNCSYFPCKISSGSLNASFERFVNHKLKERSFNFFRSTRKLKPGNAYLISNLTAYISQNLEWINLSPPPYKLLH